MLEAAWSIMTLQSISPRENALMCPYSETELIIAGGISQRPDSSTYMTCDAYIYNIDKKWVSRKVCDRVGLDLRSLSSPVVLTDGNFIALVETLNGVLKLVRFSSNTERFTVL